MYEQIFGFKSRPFTSTPFVQNYFPGESIHHALSQTRMCIDRASGPVIVTGPSGVGKSLLLAMLTVHFQTTYHIVNLLCVNMSERRDLLQNILFELKLPYRDMSEGELRLCLIDFLKGGQLGQNGILMLVDEAHNLSPELLDELRLITNFVRDGRPSVSLVMVGAPSLEDRLIETTSESFNQRIASRCYLTNLGQSETFEYISTHIERAGGNGDHLFTGDALKAVYEASDGCPRIINQICDYALVLAASQNAKRVTEHIANDAWRDVQSIPGVPAAAAAMDFNPDAGLVQLGGQGDPQDDMMVIEFGQLDDETEECQSTCDNELDSDERVPARRQNEEDDSTVYDANLTQKVPLETSNEAEMELADSDYSRSNDVDDRDRLRGYADPFAAEAFAEEEAVKASFIPSVSEQNLNSLMLSAEQLRCLESIDACDDSTLMGGPIESVMGVDNVQIAAAESCLGEDDDLKISQEGLANLEQIAYDIKRLQRDQSFSEQDFESKAVHPDYEAVINTQPIEELLQEFTTMAEDPTGDDASTLPMPPVMPEQVDDATGNNDDQDMIISQPSGGDHIAHEELPLIEESASVSTGNARRMDYEQLFHQLRQSE